MYNNYDYPCGADGPDAPWNQSDLEPVEVDVTISQSLSRSTKIKVTDYISNEWEDVEPNNKGGFYTKRFFKLIKYKNNNQSS